MPNHTIRRHVGASEVVTDWLNNGATDLEENLGTDFMSITSPIHDGVLPMLRRALENNDDRKDSLTVMLTTQGGYVETVERMVTAIRHHYGEVRFVIPNCAMSAGTILAMSGDSISMCYSSCLGPIDPQVQKDNIWVPALSYVRQYEDLIDVSQSRDLTQAEALLLAKLDLAEIHAFKLAAKLSEKLIKDWLVKYKFKDWNTHASTGEDVTTAEKIARAEQIANDLNDHSDWSSHGRPIHMEVLQKKLKLKIDDFGSNQALNTLVWDYYDCLMDFMPKHGIETAIHTRNTLMGG